MTEQDGADGQQPEFAWITRWNAIDKFFMRAERRRLINSGRSMRVLVFPWGFQWINEKDELTARWDELAAVTCDNRRILVYGIHARTEYDYRFRLTDGRNRRFQGRLNRGKAKRSQRAVPEAVAGQTTPVTIEQLGRILQSGVTRVQLPVAVERYNAGQVVSFGAVKVGPDGITAGKDSLPWSEIEGIRTQRGTVIVRKSGKWLPWKNVQVSQIPNYFVFDALVHAILAQRSSARQ